MYDRGNDTTLSVCLDPDIEQRLQELATLTGRTKSYYVREAILTQLEDMGDRYLALARLETPAPRVSLEDLERELDLDG